MHPLSCSFINPLTCSLVHSPTHLFIHSPTQPFIHSLTHLFIHSFTHSHVHSFTHSPVHSLIHSRTHLFTHSLIYSLTHSFTYSFPPSLPLWLMDTSQVLGPPGVGHQTGGPWKVGAHVLGEAGIDWIFKQRSLQLWWALHSWEQGLQIGEQLLGGWEPLTWCGSLGMQVDHASEQA